jgi:hypothetical protein
MFLTFLILPTVLLQANLIVAIGLEKLDMWFNIISLIVNVIGCFVGLYLVRELSVINYSVFCSFLVFHILQDVLLIRKKVTTVVHCLAFYIALLLLIITYLHFSVDTNPIKLFMLFSIGLFLIAAFILILQKRNVPFNLLPLKKTIN